MSTAPFRADHVGSLLRPAALHELREQVRKNEIPFEKLKEAEDRAIREVVKLQEDLGLPAITDGEFRRDWWHIDFLAGFGGIELRRDGENLGGEKRPVSGFKHADYNPRRDYSLTVSDGELTLEEREARSPRSADDVVLDV